MKPPPICPNCFRLENLINKIIEASVNLLVIIKVGPSVQQMDKKSYEKEYADASVVFIEHLKRLKLFPESKNKIINN